MKPSEVVLSVIPGENPHQRILIVSRNATPVPEVACDDVLKFEKAEKPAATIEIKQQSWGDSVGWFTQHTISVHESQLATLRASLGVATAVVRPEKPEPRTVTPQTAGWTPRVINADSA